MRAKRIEGQRAVRSGVQKHVSILQVIMAESQQACVV